MNWWVWVQSKDYNGATSYIYPFSYVPGDTADDAIDYVLTRYCATRDGQRFINEPHTRLSSAWAAPMDVVTEVQLKPINQPQYERDTL